MRRYWTWTLVVVLCSVWPSWTQEASPEGSGAAPGSGGTSVPSVTWLQGAMQDSMVGMNGEEDEGPEHIRDNAFLVEEAANQEPGVVQHIFNWVNEWDWDAGSRTRDLTFVYVMELPVGSQKHQFSFASRLLTAFAEPAGGPITQQGDIGDTDLNYRYQLLADDDFLWVSPRWTLIVPTGDERFGFGTGRLGYQFNLPISRYGDRFDFHFNAGMTYTPEVSAFLPTGARSPRRDLDDYNLGGSIFWKPAPNLHFALEALTQWVEEIDDGGAVDRGTLVTLNPGMRYAICQFDEVEWVVGVALPIGLTSETPDIGVFMYMSVEHHFRKLAGNE